MHKRVRTTDPVAFKPAIHLAITTPFSLPIETVQCPECTALYTLTGGFSRAHLFEILKQEHLNGKTHSDVIPSAGEFMRVSECTCSDGGVPR